MSEPSVKPVAKSGPIPKRHSKAAKDLGCRCHENILMGCPIHYCWIVLGAEPIDIVYPTDVYFDWVENMQLEDVVGLHATNRERDQWFDDLMLGADND